MNQRIPPKAVAGLGLIGAAVAAVVGIAIGGAVGVIVAILVVQAGTLLVVVYLWRDLHAQTARADRSVRQEIVALQRIIAPDGAALVAPRLDAIVESLQRQADANARLQRDGIRQLRVLQETGLEQADRQASKRHKELLDHQIRQRQQAVRTIQKDGRKDVTQLEALAGLYYDLRPPVAFPATRRWVASPDLLRWLHDHVRRTRPQLILECGSGLSSVIMGYALREVGAGRLVALEHHDHYSEVTRRMVEEHRLGDWVEVRSAPLQPVEIAGEAWPWYDLSALPDGSIDLVLVDGPPGGTRANARYPAVPLLLDRMGEAGVFVLDDYGRDEEHAVGQRWLEEFPSLRLEELPHEKGTAVLRRAGEA